MKKPSWRKSSRLPGSGCHPSRKIAVLLYVGALTLAAPAANAANDPWLGNTDATFGTLTNWTGSVTPNGNTPVFGAAGTSGTTLNNDIVGATYNGITYNAGASAFTIGGNSFTLGGNITNNSSSLQTINNDMTSTAARTFTGGTAGLTLGGAYTTSIAATYAGVINIRGATAISQSATANQGFLTVGNGTNSTVTLSNGGALSIGGTTNGTKPNSIVGNNVSTSALNVGASDQSSSGTLTVGAETGFVLGNNNASASGTLNINSGTATINRGSTTATDIRSFVAVGRDTGTGTINLNGGTLATDRNFVRDGSSTADASGAANFNFGGGTLKALANQTDWLNSSTKNTNQLALSSVTTTSANSTVDSNGFAVAINNAMSGAGGFNIISSSGSGTVILGGANSYTGGTTVTSGTLDVTGTLADSGAVTVSGGTYKVSNDDTVGAVTLTSGTISNASGKVLTGSSYAVQSGTVSAILGGSGDLTKTTAGMVTLSAANTYTGATTVESGTLALGSGGSISGSLVLGKVGVSTGTLDVTAKASYAQANISGKGTINIGTGKTVTATGNIAPGFSPGSIDVTGSFTLAGTAALTMELAGNGGVAGADFDFMNITETLTYGGALSITSFGGYNINQSGTYDLFNFALDAGGFSSVAFGGSGLSETTAGSGIWVNNPSTPTVTFTEATGILQVIPEPGTYAMLIGGFAALMGFQRSRRARLN